MAITIVSGNLALRFDAGSFEADKSTWGSYTPATWMGTESELPSDRDNFAVYQGTYAGVFYNSGVAGKHIIALQKFNAVSGKKYVAKARIKVSDARFAKIAADASYLRLEKEDTWNFLSAATVISECQVVDATTFLELESRFTAIGTGAAYVKLYSSLVLASPAYAGCSIDKFEIFEYADVIPPSSTLAIDMASSTINYATGPATPNGSFTVAITGGTGPYEYSKDNGGSWQSSATFAGLLPDTYAVKVREVATPANVVSNYFIVSYTGALFDFTTDITHETVIGANDGKILFNVTGTGGPFQYGVRLSIFDPAPTYQAGNLYENLPPNGYDVFVKDASDNIIQKYALVLAGALEFDKVYFHKNQVPFAKVADADWASQDNYRLYDEVRVEDVNGSGTFTKKMAVEHVPDEAGLVTFQVRQAFRGVMKPVPPILNQDIIKRITDRLKFFKHYTGELTGTDVTPSVLDGSLPNIIVWGGIDKFNAGLKTPTYDEAPPEFIIDFFKDLPTTKKFMSWAPLTKMVDSNQEDFLNFFVYEGVRSISQKVKCYYDDDTNQTGNFPGPTTSAGELYEIATGPANSYAKLVNPAKTLIKYELWLEDALDGDAVVSEVRTYILNPFRYPNTRLFMVLNSLGSFEVMCFYGAAQISNAFDRELVKKYLPVGYYAIAGEKTVNNVTRKKKGNYSSGYFTGADSAAWLDYMNDFMMSEQVYEITDGKRRPVIITDGTVESEDQNYKRFFRFTADDAYDNNVYTP